MTNPTNLPESLGIITTNAGTPKALVSNLSAEKQTMKAHWFQVQALPTNTGYAYIGFSGMNKATGELCLKILQAGETWACPVHPMGGSIFNMERFYLDVQNNGDGVLACAYAV